MWINAYNDLKWKKYRTFRVYAYISGIASAESSRNRYAKRINVEKLANDVSFDDKNMMNRQWTVNFMLWHHQIHFEIVQSRPLQCASVIMLIGFHANGSICDTCEKIVIVIFQMIWSKLHSCGACFVLFTHYIFRGRLLPYRAYSYSIVCYSIFGTEPHGSRQIGKRDETSKLCEASVIVSSQFESVA